MPNSSQPYSSQPYVGRFAPSPTGPLHFGSLIGALASFLDARSQQGRWLVRIEDIDPAREIPGAAMAILECLRAHGLDWDGDVIYQSERFELYRDAYLRLCDEGRAFYCTCSRTDLLANRGIYDGRCRTHRHPPTPPYAVRLLTDAETIEFDDRIQGKIRENIGRDVGDFVIYRKEQLPAYQLAVVIDDAAQQITQVVRGCDLLGSTGRQIYLQQCLHLPSPHYAHFPVIANSERQKLSKQTQAPALDNRHARDNLLAALEFLSQPLPTQPLPIDRLLNWAIAHWNIDAIPRQRLLHGDLLPPSCRRFAS